MRFEIYIWRMISSFLKKIVFIKSILKLSDVAIAVCRKYWMHIFQRKFGGKSIHKKRCIYRVCVLRSRASGSTTLRHPSSPFSGLPDNLSDISASDESDDSRSASPVLGGESLEDFVEKGLTSSPLKNFNSSVRI